MSLGEKGAGAAAGANGPNFLSFAGVSVCILLTVRGNSHGVVCTWGYFSIPFLLIFSKFGNPNLGHNLTCHELFSAGTKDTDNSL